MIYSLTQGNDEIVTIPIIINNVEIDLSTANAIKVALYCGKTIPNIASTDIPNFVWSLNPSSGEGTLQINDTDNYKIDIISKREENINFITGNATLVVLYDFVDALFPNGKTNQVVIPNFLIKKGVGLAVQMP